MKAYDLINKFFIFFLLPYSFCPLYAGEVTPFKTKAQLEQKHESHLTDILKENYLTFQKKESIDEFLVDGKLNSFYVKVGINAGGAFPYIRFKNQIFNLDLMTTSSSELSYYLRPFNFNEQTNQWEIDIFHSLRDEKQGVVERGPIDWNEDQQDLLYSREKKIVNAKVQKLKNGIYKLNYQHIDFWNEDLLVKYELTREFRRVPFTRKFLPHNTDYYKANSVEFFLKIPRAGRDIERMLANGHQLPLEDRLHIQEVIRSGSFRREVLNIYNNYPRNIDFDEIFPRPLVNFRKNCLKAIFSFF